MKGAVTDFFAPLGLQVVVTYKENAWHTWMVRKPKASPASPEKPQLVGGHMEDRQTPRAAPTSA